MIIPDHDKHHHKAGGGRFAALAHLKAFCFWGQWVRTGGPGRSAERPAGVPGHLLVIVSYLTVESERATKNQHRLGDENGVDKTTGGRYWCRY